VTGRLIIASNRLPVSIERQGGRVEVKPATGGLVTALVPVLRQRGGVWIGWSGATGPADDLAPLLRAAGRKSGYGLRGVALDEREVAGYYRGFANEILWPLFHDLPGRCNFQPAYWGPFAQVNARFAATIERAWQAGDLVWVHDYHLMLVGRFLREGGFPGRTAFFLHIPFPPPDIFRKLPWRKPLLEALLAYDLLGFQTGGDRRRFLECVRQLLPEARPRIRPHGEPAAPGREVRVGAFPISIDVGTFARQARSPEVERETERIRRALLGRKLVLGLDRLDYSKGIPQRLRAFAAALEAEPALRGRVSLLQVVVPSRTRVAEYRDFKAEIDQLVGTLNGRYAETGWTPIQYRYRSLSREQLLAHYRAADVAFVTPLKDGMNLVAKEYCAARVDGDGVLVLSEFAGAAVELKSGALLVNPYDEQGTAEALCHALSMEEAERRARMARMRDHLAAHDVFGWVDSFLEGLDAPAEGEPLVPARGWQPPVE
jgi:trehalose 6-phosphate synthase